jgi:2-polyprenyl-3-methyl-5-hydroxy-6-metoxy-1,4-benzoquinol methylase
MHPLLSIKEAGALYEQKVYYDEICAHDHRLEQVDRFPWEGFLERLGTFYPQKGRLLDVGSGTGYFLNLAKSKGWEVFGIDNSSFANNYSRQKYNLNIINGSLLEVNLAPGSFEVITLWNVLEHLNDPLAAINKIRGLLKDNGIFAFSVPNMDSFEARFFGKNWAVLRPKEKGHMYYFTPYAIDYILDTTGFRIEYLYSWGGFGLRSHLLGKDTQARGKSFILERIALLARSLVSRLKKGGILIAVARKTGDAKL